ncbi:hypothetical protein SAY86_003293 [Trapa natans]|uniref:MADS-box domain-containing protein n=1 Tax=Trapa natans TaxID=22666 RepID=A0AAN7RMM7_TRANT|nr:hypothetical protein SAY86_003293 [Trapa natans]
MPRWDVQLEYIRSPRRRKATYMKRKKGLLKKVYELSTLCDVHACAVVYHSDYDAKPEVWPSLEKANPVIERYRSLPEIYRQRTTMDQGAYLTDRILKGEERLKKIKVENWETEMEDLIYEALERPEPSLQGITDPTAQGDVLFMAEKILKRINVRMQSLGMTSGRPQPPPPSDIPADDEYIQGSLRLHQADRPVVDFSSYYQQQPYLYSHDPRDEAARVVMSAGVARTSPSPPNPPWYMQQMVNPSESLQAAPAYPQYPRQPEYPLYWETRRH